jgi:hypothetical protein
MTTMETEIHAGEADDKVWDIRIPCLEIGTKRPGPMVEFWRVSHKSGVPKENLLQSWTCIVA